MRILMKIKLHFKCQVNLLKVFGKIISGAGFQKSAPAASLLRCASQCVKVESCFLFNLLQSHLLSHQRIFTYQNKKYIKVQRIHCTHS